MLMRGAILGTGLILAGSRASRGPSHRRRRPARHAARQHARRDAPRGPAVRAEPLHQPPSAHGETTRPAAQRAAPSTSSASAVPRTRHGSEHGERDPGDKPERARGWRAAATARVGGGVAERALPAGARPVSSGARTAAFSPDSDLGDREPEEAGAPAQPGAAPGGAGQPGERDDTAAPRRRRRAAARARARATRGPARGSSSGTGSAAKASTGRCRSRPASGDASQHDRQPRAASQPIRGSSAASDAPRPRARGGRGERRRRPERVEAGERDAAGAGRRRRPAPTRVASESRSTGSAAPRQRPRRRASRPKRSSVVGLDQAALVGELARPRRRAPSRSCSSAGRQLGVAGRARRRSPAELRAAGRGARERSGGRCVPSAAGGGHGACGRARGSRRSSPRRASARASRRRRRRSRARPRPARAPCRRACPTTSPVARERVAAREVGDAEVGELGEAGAGGGLGDDDHVLRLHVAVDDLRARARGRARRRGGQPIRATSRSDSAPPRFSSAKVRPVDELGDEVDGLVVAAPSSYSATMPGWFSRAAARASRSAPRVEARPRRPCGIDLDGHLALELLVEGEPDGAEAARRRACARAGSGRARARRSAGRVPRARGRCRSAPVVVGGCRRRLGAVLASATSEASRPTWCGRASSASSSLPPGHVLISGARSGCSGESIHCVGCRVHAEPTGIWTLGDRQIPLPAHGPSETVPSSTNRRPAAPVGSGDRRRRGPGTDRQTLMMRRDRRGRRRSLVLVLLVLRIKRLPRRAEGAGVQGLRARRRRAARGVEPDSKRALRACSTNGSQSAVDLQNKRQRLRVAGGTAGRSRQGHRPPRRARRPRSATWSRRSSSAATASRRSPTSCRPRSATSDRSEAAERDRGRRCRVPRERRDLQPALPPRAPGPTEEGEAHRPGGAAEPLPAGLRLARRATVAGPIAPADPAAATAAPAGGRARPARHGPRHVTVQPGGTGAPPGGGDQIKAAAPTSRSTSRSPTRARTTRRTSRSRS